MNPQLLKNIIEAALLTANGPLPMVRLQALFVSEDEAETDADAQPDIDQIKETLEALSQDYAERGIELKLVSSGYRIQARQEMGRWLNQLNEDKPSRYSRALLETLALMAYRQPITRAGVEDIRGVSVSSSIIKTLIEREWIRVVGHRDVPGRPALYGTTKQFLDYFNLEGLGELPPLAEMRSIEDIQREFDLKFNEVAAGAEAADSEDDSEAGLEQAEDEQGHSDDETVAAGEATQIDTAVDTDGHAETGSAEADSEATEDSVDNDVDAESDEDADSAARHEADIAVVSQSDADTPAVEAVSMEVEFAQSETVDLTEDEEGDKPMNEAENSPVNAESDVDTDVESGVEPGTKNEAVSAANLTVSSAG